MTRNDSTQQTLPSVDDLKAEARTVAEAQGLSLGQGLEAVARSRGYGSWVALKAAVSKAQQVAKCRGEAAQQPGTGTGTSCVSSTAGSARRIRAMRQGRRMRDSAHAQTDKIVLRALKAVSSDEEAPPFDVSTVSEALSAQWEQEHEARLSKQGRSAAGERLARATAANLLVNTMKRGAVTDAQFKGLLVECSTHAGRMAMIGRNMASQYSTAIGKYMQPGSSARTAE